MITRRRLLQATPGLLLPPALTVLTSCGGSSPSDSGGTPGTGDCAAATPTATAASPRGLHVSWTDDPFTTRTVTWFTDGSDDPGTVIEYGPVEDGMSDCEIAQTAMPNRVEGSTKAVYDVDALTHSATISGLDEGKAVRYRVGSDAGWSDVRVLQPQPRDTFRFAHFGDHATSDASRAVLAGVQARAPDFVVIAGDLSYANGEQPVWDTYFDMLDPVASRLPVMTCPGNHENKDGDGDGYRSRVSQPGQGTYYSFDHGRVHFCFSTGGSLLTGVAGAPDLLAELAWLETDLAAAALRRANGEIDFIVFVQHYTIWTDSDGRDPANFTLVLLEEHLLVNYGVDLLAVGHDHIYERSQPMAYGQPLAGGYVQITQGGGGQSLYSLTEELGTWAAFATLRHGFTEYAVDATAIRGTTYSVENDAGELLPDGELQIIDQFEIPARSATDKATYAQRPKAIALNGFDYDAMILHTIERNRLHDLQEAGEH
ncbi:purple acid phosphatase family protein [Solimonas marina]|uniref:Metallophosphoesterase family protein n=1 Tax=Solimonas marina TaxID=2714601 RepID=A0A970B774_9GAMM|nr:metallophosphoesterase family protein [Solimonas marina]NKF23360.1 metallophosphoesterase family protein [Solimonas marina]